MDTGASDIVIKLLLSIIIAIIGYGFFPVCFSLFSPKISRKKYYVISYLVNILVFLIFYAVDGNPNAAPYAIWTALGCFIGKSHLPEVEPTPPVSYADLPKHTYEEIESMVPDDVIQFCKSKRGNRQELQEALENMAMERKIPYDYILPLLDEYMKPVNHVGKKEFVETVSSIDEKRKMFCRNCGKQIPTDSKFCSYCGTEVNNQVEPDAGNNKVYSKKESFLGKLLRYKNGILLYISIAVAGIAFVFLLYTFTTHPIATSTLPSPVPTQIQTPEPTLTREAMPENGKMFVNPDYESVCPFSFSGEYGASYYVYLEYQYAPNNSYYSRHENTSDPTEENIAFFVRPGYSVDIDVPVGIYKLYYAFGNGWYGSKDLFGKDTTYCTVGDLLEFYTDNTTAYGININLRAQYDGNFETEYITASQFPG